MIKKMTLLILMLLMIAIISSCGDDDPIAPSDNLTGIFGEAYVSPDLRVYADCIPVTPNATKIDSVIFGERKRVITQSYWDIYGDDNYYYMSYYNYSDTLEYTAGDTIDINFYNGNDHAVCYVKLLLDENSPDIISPDNNDTTDIGESTIITWHQVEFADWYGIWISYYYDSLGESVYKGISYYTTDTVFTFDGSNITDNGYFYFNVMAVTGPLPGIDNISSSTMYGTMHSDSYSDYITIYTGTGSIGPVPIAKPANQDDPEKLKDEILKNILSNY